MKSHHSKSYKALIVLLGAIAAAPVLAGEAADAQSQAAALLSSGTTVAVRPSQHDASSPQDAAEVRLSAQAHASVLLQGTHAATKKLSVATNQTSMAADENFEGAATQAQRMLRGESLKR